MAERPDRVKVQSDVPAIEGDVARLLVGGGVDDVLEGDLAGTPATVLPCRWTLAPTAS